MDAGAVPASSTIWNVERSSLWASFVIIWGMKNTLQLDFSNKASNVSFADERVIKIWGDGLGWTREEAEGVLADHTQYLENLAAVGIQTSEIVSREISAKDDGNYLIKEQELNAGKDVAAVLLGASNVDVLLGAVDSNFRGIARLLLSIPPKGADQYSHDCPWFNVPVDLKPQNVVVSDVNEVIVIDTFGPKLWIDDKIKPLPTRVPGKGQILHDEIKVGDVRFSLGRLSGYFMALSTRWLVASQPDVSPIEIDALRFRAAGAITRITSELLYDNNLFANSYSELLLADLSEIEMRSINYGIYEGPKYVQELYEREAIVQKS